MLEHPTLSVATFTSAPRRDWDSGLLGWISCQYGDLVLDGIALRRTRAGRLTLSFPERRDSAGRRHAYFRPLDDATRRAIEVQVFAALGLEQTEEVAG